MAKNHTKNFDDTRTARLWAKSLDELLLDVHAFVTGDNAPHAVWSLSFVSVGDVNSVDAEWMAIITWYKI